jgi:carbamoylphosphate synthase large subunit
MYKVIISASGTGNGFAFCEAISNNFTDVELICTDINPAKLNATSVFCDHYYKVPKINDPSYLSKVEDILKFHKPDFYIALVDVEFSSVAELCELNKVKLIGLKSPLLLSDKYLYLSELDTVGVNSPHMADLVDNIFWEHESYIQKPRLGFGSIGTSIISKDKLSNKEGSFYQEFICGQEVTVDCFFDASNGYFKSITRDRLETKLGVTTKSRVYFSAELDILCKKIMNKLQLDGGACIQFMESDRGWLVIDVNPRLGAGSKISAVSGNDFFSATLAYHFNLDYKKYFNNIGNSELYVVRQYQEIVTQC